MAECVTIGAPLEFVTFSDFPGEVLIYAIRGEETVYVGSTSQTIRARIRSHINDARNGSDIPIHAWMRGRSFRFEVVFLERCREESRVIREKYWVSVFDGLLNITDGGPGHSGNYFAGTSHAKKIADRIRRGSNCSCIHCGLPFWRKPREIKLGHNKFCSRSCYQAWQIGRPKGRVKA